MKISIEYFRNIQTKNFKALWNLRNTVSEGMADLVRLGPRTAFVATRHARIWISSLFWREILRSRVDGMEAHMSRLIVCCFVAVRKLSFSHTIIFALIKGKGFCSDHLILLWSVFLEFVLIMCKKIIRIDENYIIL